MAGSKILITGAAGFIGSHLVELLLAKKIPASRLRLVVKPGESLLNLPERKFETVRTDIRHRINMVRAMKGVGTVYHLAARIDFEGQNYSDYYDINVQATEQLLQACKGKRIDKFIFYSSIAVYGLPAGVGDIINFDETHPPAYSNHYGRSKWEAEEKVRQAHQQFGLPYAIIRPASVYGPREKGPTLALYQAIKQGQFMMIGNGQNKMHYVYVKDLVEGTYEAKQSQINDGEYILAGPSPTKFKDVIKAVAQSIDCPVSGFHLPKGPVLLASYGLEAIGRLTGIKPPLFPSRVRTMTASYYYNSSKAKRAIKYQPLTSFAAGAKLTGKWYLDHHWL